MKKVILASVIAATSLMAASDKQIEDFYSQMVDSSVKVKVADRHKVAGDIEAVVVKLSKDGNSQDEIVFTKGDFIFPDVIDLKEQKSYLAEVKKEVIAKGISKIYKDHAVIFAHALKAIKACWLYKLICHALIVAFL